VQVSLSEEDARLFKGYYSKLMYQAILTATQKSLQVRRGCGYWWSMPICEHVFGLIGALLSAALVCMLTSFMLFTPSCLLLEGTLECHYLARTHTHPQTHARTHTYTRLQAMKRRLGSKVSSGFLFMERPFFNVDVELKVGVVIA